MTIQQAVSGFAVVALGPRSRFRHAARGVTAVRRGLLTMIPGIDTALVLRSAVSRGRPEAFATVLGVSCGVLVWGAAAAVGAAALLTASRIGYDVVRLLGAAYLVVLGVRMLVGAVRRRAEPVHDAGPAAPRRGPVRAWATGAATNLLNPKVGVF